MNASDPVDLAEVAKSKAISHEIGIDEKKEPVVDASAFERVPSYTIDASDRVYPTDEEMTTLRRVSDNIPWAAYTVAFVELCERFSYYGTTAVCMECLESRNGLIG